MSAMVFGINLIDDTVANVTESSEQTTYPASNAYDLQRRKRVWRSGGFFRVVSGDNTITFREIGTTDLVATIAAGDYATDALFIAAIATALNAAGAATYTVTRDATTNRIKLTSAGDNGVSYFQPRFAADDSMCVSLGFAATNLTGAISYEADLLVLHTEERLTWDLGNPANPTGFIAIGSSRELGMKISPAAVVKLQGNWTNDFDTPSVTYTIPFRDFCFALTDEDGLADVTYGYRYWSMQIVDQANPYGYVELGAVMLGIHLTLERGCPNFPFNNPKVDATDVAYSEGGQTFAKRNYLTERFELNWRLLTRADSLALREFADSVGKHTPFFIAMDPNDVIDADGKNYFKLVRFDQDPIAALESPGHWTMPWSLREEL